MIFLGTLLLSALVLGTLFGSFKKSNYYEPVTPGYRGDPDFKPKQLIKTIVAAVLSLVVAILNPISMERIDVGHVGLKINNTGDERGVAKTTYVTGWVFYNSFLSRIKEYPVSQQHIDYSEEDIITRGGFTARIKPSFNWSVNPESAADMYQNLRQDVDQIKDSWLKNAIVGAVNDVANLYTVDSIFNHRAEFEKEIVLEANKRVSKWFTVSQLRTNILPPKEITEAINAKTRAVQEAQGAVQQRIVAENQALTQIATAKGDSAELVINASARAEAVRKEQQYLTPMYIDFLRASKWDGKYPTTLLGGNASTLLNLK